MFLAFLDSAGAWWLFIFSLNSDLQELVAERAGLAVNPQKRKNREPVDEEEEEEDEEVEEAGEGEAAAEGEEEEEDSGYESPEDGLTPEERLRSKLLSKKDRRLFNNIRFSQKKRKDRMIGR